MKSIFLFFSLLVHSMSLFAQEVDIDLANDQYFTFIQNISSTYSMLSEGIRIRDDAYFISASRHLKTANECFQGFNGMLDSASYKDATTLLKVCNNVLKIDLSNNQEIMGGISATTAGTIFLKAFMKKSAHIFVCSNK